MAKKLNSETELNNSDNNNHEVLVDPNTFDLSILQDDIKEAEKELKDAYNQALIEKANKQKETEIVQDSMETTQDFKTTIHELLEFIFSFLNVYLRKYEITPLDDKFISSFLDKVISVFPKDQLSKIYETFEFGNKQKKSLKTLKLFDLISFITRELFKRWNEYSAYKKIQKQENPK